MTINDLNDCEFLKILDCSTDKPQNIKELYLTVINEYAPNTLKYSAEYYIHCLIEELYELNNHLSIKFWKKKSTSGIPDKIIFEVVDVYIFLLLISIIKCSKWVPYIKNVNKYSNYKLNGIFQNSIINNNSIEGREYLAKLFNDITRDVLMLNTDCNTKYKTYMFSETLNKIISTLVHITNITVDNLHKAVVYKILLLSVRFNNNKYVENWSNVDSKGVHIDDWCTECLMNNVSISDFYNKLLSKRTEYMCNI